NRLFNVKISVEEIETITLNNDELDFIKLRNMSGNDGSFYIEMLETFKTTSLNSFKAMEIGLSNDDFDLIKSEAHKISSPCKHLGANELYQILKSIELANETDTTNKHFKKKLKGLKIELDKVINLIDIELKSIK